MAVMILKNPAKNSPFANFFVKLTACFGELAEFERKIRQISDIARLPLSQFEIDHLAVRMNNIETAYQWRTLLEEGAALLKESEVNGRPISLFRLYQPLDFLGQRVSVIELPFPKGKVYAEQGWEHIEAVVPLLPAETIEQWITRVCTQFQLAENPALILKISQPYVSGERLANPTIAIRLRDATYSNPTCLKLHPYSIDDVVRSESRD